MFKYVIRTIYGFQGSIYYDTHHDALNAAIFRTNISGIPWYVTAVKVG